MLNYTPRQSSSASNLPMIAAAGFVGLGVLAVAGVFVYHQLWARGEAEVVASVPAADGTGQKASKIGAPASHSGEKASKIGAPAPQAPQVSGESNEGNDLREKVKADEMWRAEVQLEIVVARREQKQIKEPIQAPLTTTAEYQKALRFVPNFKDQYPVEGPIREWLLLLKADRPPYLFAASVLPESSRLLRREAFTQIARFDRQELDQKVTLLEFRHPDIRLLLDNTLYTKLRSRLPWEQRKALYEKFQSLTGVRGQWSLLQPFDDLSGPEMTAAVDAAEKLKGSGLRALTPDERLALLTAGAVDAVEDALPAGWEDRP